MRGPPPGFAAALATKYAILQQQADAQTGQVAVAQQNADSNAIAAKAAAELDKIRASLMPAESKTNIAKTEAETGLVGQQAKYFGPESLARIANLKAETGLTNTNAAIAKREGLDLQSRYGALASGIFGLQYPRGF